MKTQAMLLAALMLAGCGTVQTVVRNDDVAVKSLKEKKSYCAAVPRIYSGVTYDFCTLHAPLKAGIDPEKYNNGTIFVLIDVVISGAFDTLLLPYTLYRQQADGSIIVTE
ncbi:MULTISPECIES: YceK/YidQ family lipoprotein [unclassified Pseudomonas]|uniref:YceK/YidQ family lipoprotein n=1 Tax=unclassified Pseudomonas TaxID=196821 RepID=UPI002AC97ED6|nr:MULTISPECIES: YceK/YidQ family lipoprotein [unclassified Pseudomonas]MEB0048266.1 YceK/YidQ family lipoprotein [Pseudomonas sp. Dout3]MEB0099219.1 YceK/YidQ family lipoprotein [Pseudomonas sp. DC1.2]WPX61193.1 YceK/YidQ family lipoprotein [Pseudomonas sp. DC1.2]